eukprot:3019589-Amphidinium_carterae.1
MPEPVADTPPPRVEERPDAAPAPSQMVETPIAAVPVPKPVPASLQIELPLISSSRGMIQPSIPKAPPPKLVEQKQNNPTSTSASSDEKREPIIGN